MSSSWLSNIQRIGKSAMSSLSVWLWNMSFWRFLRLLSSQYLRCFWGWDTLVDPIVWGGVEGNSAINYCNELLRTEQMMLAPSAWSATQFSALSTSVFPRRAKENRGGSSEINWRSERRWPRGALSTLHIHTRRFCGKIVAKSNISWSMDIYYSSETLTTLVCFTELLYIHIYNYNFYPNGGTHLVLIVSFRCSVGQPSLCPAIQNMKVIREFKIQNMKLRFTASLE